MNKTWSSSSDLDATLGGITGRALVGVGATAAIFEIFGREASLKENEARRASKRVKKKVGDESQISSFSLSSKRAAVLILDTVSPVSLPRLCYPSTPRAISLRSVHCGAPETRRLAFKRSRNKTRKIVHSAVLEDFLRFFSAFFLFLVGLSVFLSTSFFK